MSARWKALTSGEIVREVDAAIGEGMSHREIASLLGCDEMTLGGVVNRARADCGLMPRDFVSAPPARVRGRVERHRDDGKRIRLGSRILEAAGMAVGDEYVAEARGGAIIIRPANGRGCGGR